MIWIVYKQCLCSIYRMASSCLQHQRHSSGQRANRPAPDPTGGNARTLCQNHRLRGDVSRSRSVGVAARRFGGRHPVRAIDWASAGPVESPRHQVAAAKLRGAAWVWHGPAGCAAPGPPRFAVCRRLHRGYAAAGPLVGAQTRVGSKDQRAYFRRHGHLRRLGYCRREFGDCGFRGGKRCPSGPFFC